MKTTFKQSLAGAAPAGPALPLVHTTSVPAFEDIGDDNRLKTTKCTVYTKDSLVYLFYGKPSYRPPDKDTTYLNMVQFAPVCLVLRPCVGAVGGSVPRRVMPFDSGAYHHGIMTKEGHAHRSLPKERFEMADADDAGRIVALYFGSNLNYMREQAEIAPHLDPNANTCVETYVSLISRTGTNVGDSRLNTIEIQFDQEIDLSAAVLAVALAAPLYDRPEVKEKLAAWQAEPLLYEITGRYTPGWCCQTIDNLVENFLRCQGYL